MYFLRTAMIVSALGLLGHPGGKLMCWIRRDAECQAEITLSFVFSRSSWTNSGCCKGHHRWPAWGKYDLQVDLSTNDHAPPDSQPCQWVRNSNVKRRHAFQKHLQRFLPLWDCDVLVNGRCVYNPSHLVPLLVPCCDLHTPETDLFFLHFFHLLLLNSMYIYYAWNITTWRAL